jgi:hypothetical protein
MKEVKSIDPKLLEGLDDKMLNQFRQALSAETGKRRAEKQAKNKRKAEYTLIVPVREYRQDHQMMWLTLLGKLNEDGSITPEEAKAIEQRFTRPIPYELPKVYPCPGCGQMRLYVGNYSEGHRDNNKVALTFEESLSKLVGEVSGKKVYTEQVRGKLDFSQTAYIKFPSHIVRISSSFVHGFFRETLDDYGVSFVGTKLFVEGDEQLVSSIMENLL